LAFPISCHWGSGPLSSIIDQLSGDWLSGGLSGVLALKVVLVEVVLVEGVIKGVVEVVLVKGCSSGTGSSTSSYLK